jgi:hypothetical protein
VPGSYSHWLRHLPLLAPGSPVRDYTGATVYPGVGAIAAVVDLDVGRRDVQHCMDTVMRLRAEYLWWRGQGERVRFRYVHGGYLGWSDWSRGLRPRPVGSRIHLEQSAPVDRSRAGFDRYLFFMFMMTGSIHNIREPFVQWKDLQAGDFFVQAPPRPGSLGHAVVVLDIARNDRGEVIALLAEGFVPAQDMHVLAPLGGGTWFRMDPSTPVKTPIWHYPFQWSELRRFRC